MKVVFLGCTSEFGFSFGANITKVGYMAKGLCENGASCSIHNGVDGSPKVSKDQTVLVDGVYVTTFKQRHSKFLSWIFNISRLYKYLKHEKKSGEQNIAILELEMYHIFLLYIIMLKVLGYTIVDISHEWAPTIKSKHFMKNLSSRMFAASFGWFVDGILPISEFIISKIKHFNKPLFKLPVMADFNDNYDYKKSQENRFVYCASVYYIRIIQMIINAFAQYKKEGGNVNLTLVLNGPEALKQKVKDYITELDLNDFIIIKSKLPYADLLNEYYNACALLIPLDPNYVQDRARFSQKIAEYLTTKSPIITNNVGEIQYYFNSDEVILCNYSEEGFKQAFKWTEDNLEEAVLIGERGYEKGQINFDYRVLGQGMVNFFKTLH